MHGLRHRFKTAEMEAGIHPRISTRYKGTPRERRRRATAKSRGAGVLTSGMGRCSHSIPRR
jgi:hypothetical protein